MFLSERFFDFLNLNFLLCSFVLPSPVVSHYVRSPPASHFSAIIVPSFSVIIPHLNAVIVFTSLPLTTALTPLFAVMQA